MAKKAKRPKTPMARIEAVAQTHWRPVPGDPDSRVPTTLDAVQAMEDVIVSLADEAEADGDLAEALLPYVKSCLWGRRESFVGTWAAPIGGAFAVVVLLWIGRNAGVDWLAASMVWAAAVPLYFQAAVAAQVDVNADVVAGTQTVDDRFLAFVAAGAPILTPLWLALRAAVLGLVLPSIVMQEAVRRRKFIPAIALVAITLGATVFATATRADPGAVVGADAVEATPEPPPAPLVPVVVADGVEHRLVADQPITISLADGEPDTSRLGPPTSTDDRSAGGCTTILRTWEGPPAVRERSTRCPGQSETTFEYALR